MKVVAAERTRRGGRARQEDIQRILAHFSHGRRDRIRPYSTREHFAKHSANRLVAASLSISLPFSLYTSSGYCLLNTLPLPHPREKTIQASIRTKRPWGEGGKSKKGLEVRGALSLSSLFLLPSAWQRNEGKKRRNSRLTNNMSGHNVIYTCPPLSSSFSPFLFSSLACLFPLSSFRVGSRYNTVQPGEEEEEEGEGASHKFYGLSGGKR